jgi:hypothetical protein
MRMESFRETAEAVGDALHLSGGWIDTQIDLDSALWYGRLLSAIALAVGGEPIEYVSGSYSWATQDREAFLAKVVVYTASCVIHSEFGGETGREDAVFPPVSVFSRSSLQKLVIRTPVHSFQMSAATSWPGDFTVSLSYANTLSFQLPLSPEIASHRVDALVGLLSHLKVDLAAQAPRTS